MVIANGTIAARAPKIFIRCGSDRIKCTNGPRDQTNSALATWRFKAANRLLVQHGLCTRYGKQAFYHAERKGVALLSKQLPRVAAKPSALRFLFLPQSARIADASSGDDRVHNACTVFNF